MAKADALRQLSLRPRFFQSNNKTALLTRDGRKPANSSSLRCEKKEKAL
jgi:hypothetical protein